MEDVLGKHMEIFPGELLLKFLEVPLTKTLNEILKRSMEHVLKTYLKKMNPSETFRKELLEDFLKGFIVQYQKEFRKGVIKKYTFFLNF